MVHLSLDRESCCLGALCDLGETDLWPDSRTLEAVRDFSAVSSGGDSLPVVACAALTTFTLIKWCACLAKQGIFVIRTQNEADLKINKLTLDVLFCGRHSEKYWKKIISYLIFGQITCNNIFICGFDSQPCRFFLVCYSSAFIWSQISVSASATAIIRIPCPPSWCFFNMPDLWKDTSV